jgi:putative nucleotidyltransferase with HDIG domain
VRLLYRTRQFWQSLSAAPAPDDIGGTRRVLSPSLMALFLRMQASEQAHSLDIFGKLANQGDTNHDLLVAALLHDVGKSRQPLRPWERALVVAGKALFPGLAKRWGQSPPGGRLGNLRLPFVVAEQHPQWGAEMAAQAGASPLAVALIKRHQDVMQTKPATLEDRLLLRLQLLDDES